MTSIPTYIPKSIKNIFSHVNSDSVAKYANKMPKLNVDMQRSLKTAKILKADKFERLASEMNATKEKFPLAEIPELKVAKLPLWKKVLGKISG